MDHIDTTFTNTIDPDSEANPAIRAAVALGKKTLNQYYSKTDMVEVYRIAMGKSLLFVIFNIFTEHYVVLHPRHKLEYFKTAAWEDDWMEIAESLVRNEFECLYSSLQVSDEENEEGDVEEVTSSVRCSMFDTYLMFR